MNKAGKILLYSLPVIIGGGFLFWYIKRGKTKSKNTPSYKPPANPNPAKEPTTQVINTKNNYPLKSGSKGPQVVELQQILNSAGASPKLVEDGIFGAKTQAALKKYYGKTSISSGADFIIFKGKIQTDAAKNTGYARAVSLMNSYNSNSSSQIYTTLETTMRVIIANADGSYLDTDKTITFDKLSLFPHNRFVPQAPTNSGEIRCIYTTPTVPVSFMVLANPTALAVK